MYVARLWTLNKAKNIANQQKLVKSPNWLETDKLVIYVRRSSIQHHRRQIHLMEGGFKAETMSSFVYFEKKKKAKLFKIVNPFYSSPSSAILVTFCFRINPLVFFFLNKPLKQ